MCVSVPARDSLRRPGTKKGYQSIPMPYCEQVDWDDGSTARRVKALAEVKDLEGRECTGLVTTTTVATTMTSKNRGNNRCRCAHTSFGFVCDSGASGFAIVQSVS